MLSPFRETAPKWRRSWPVICRPTGLNQNGSTHEEKRHNGTHYPAQVPEERWRGRRRNSGSNASCPSDRAIFPRDQMALDRELAKIARRAVWAAEHFAKVVAEATDNKFQIQSFAAGEIVPGLQATDAVSSGTVELATLRPTTMWGKDPTFAFGCAVPFGLNTPHAECLVARGRRRAARKRLLCQAQHLRPPRRAIPARRWAAGSARRSTRPTTSTA